MKLKTQLKLGIGFKLMTMFVILITIPLMILGINSYLKSEDLLEEELKDSTFQTLNQTSYAITNYLSGIGDSVTMMSKDPNVQGILSNPEWEVWMMKTFKSYIESHDDVEKIFLGTKDKRMYVYPRHDYGSEYDPTQRDWYKEAISQNRLVWTKPYKSASTGKMQISAAMPVYNKGNGNEFIGVIAISLPLDNLAAKINEIQIGQKGYVFLTDNEVNVLTHKDSSLVGKPVSIERLAQEMKNNIEGIVDYEMDENGEIKKKFSIFKTIDGLGWKMAAVMYVDEIQDRTSILLKNTLIFGIISMIIAISVSYLFSKTIIKPVKKLSDNMERIKNGDFSVRVDVKNNDEIGLLGKGFNIMAENLSNLVKEVQKVSAEVSTSAEALALISEETSKSSEEITRTVEEISKGASEQASDTERAAFQTNSLSNKLGKLTQSSEEMMAYASEVIDVNSKGVKAIMDLDNKTKINSKSTERIEGAINELINQIGEISGILDTISSIAEQTNLLALNASIEAARAGEHGKGFAVVADEIRKLAQESSKASEEIRDIIGNVQDKGWQTASIMKEVKERTKDQNEAVSSVNISFETVSNSIIKMINKIEFINEFINEINTDKDTIVESIENISSVSQQTAAASQEVNATVEQQFVAIQEVAREAEELKKLIKKLEGQMSMFKI